MLRVLGRAWPVTVGWRGWISTVITSLLVSSSLVLSGFADVTNLNPNESISLSQLTSGLSLQVGDKLFSEFDFRFDGSPQNSGGFPASSVLVSPLLNQFGLGISFQLPPLFAASNETKDVVLKFSVQVVGSDNLISDAHLAITSSATGSAFADVAESITTGGFGGTSIGSLDVANPTNSPLLASTIFSTPQNQIWVEKDISVVAFGTGINDRAVISIVDQTFSQVPEPSTIALMVTGVVLLRFVNRRRLR
jgi:hypothetical protein